MTKLKKLLSLIMAVVITLCVLTAGAVSASAATYNWAGSWGTPAIESGVVLGSDSALAQNGIHLRDYIPANSTIRTTVVPTLGGSRIRLKFSNLYGTEAITINEATVAKTGATDDVVISDTITPLTFNGGSTSVRIAAGSEVYTDAADFETTALEKISISTYFRSSTRIYVAGLYGGASYLCTSLGNKTHSADVTSFATRLDFTSNSITYNTIPFLTRVDVYAENAYCVVLAGDSTVTNDAYIYLARKLISSGVNNVGVVMSGIIGNSLLHDGVGLLGKVYGQAFVDRFKRDALDIAGARYIIVKVGVNDILHPLTESLKDIAVKSTPNEIIDGYKNLAQQAADRGINIFLCTRTPYKGYERNFVGQKDINWSQEAENQLVEINSWIRHTAKTYGITSINLDAMRDPSDSTKLRSQLTTDGIHFSDLGQIAFVDLLPESSYGVNRNLTDVSKIVNKNPYAAPTTQAATTAAPTTAAPSSSGSTQQNTTAAGSQGGTSAQTTEGTTASVVLPGGAIMTTEPFAGSTANQILMNDTQNQGGVSGTVTDDSSTTKQIVGYSILAAVALGIIAVALVFIIRTGSTNKAPLTRAYYGARRKRKS